MNGLRQQLPSPGQTPRRSGCLGCFGQVLVTLGLGVVLVLAMTGAFMPWGFFLGGKFHIIPYWQGLGRLHSNNSGDYVLFVRFEPSFRGGSRLYPSSQLKGVGYLCTPRGERFRLYLRGSMPAHLKPNTNGEKITLSMDYWPILTGQLLTDHRPSLKLRGHWENPNLVMDDTGSIWNEFSSDGSVYRGNDPHRPYSKEIIPITLKQGSYSEFETACGTVRRR